MGAPRDRYEADLAPNRAYVLHVVLLVAIPVVFASLAFGVPIDVVVILIGCALVGSGICAAVGRRSAVFPNQVAWTLFVQESQRGARAAMQQANAVLMAALLVLFGVLGIGFGTYLLVGRTVASAPPPRPRGVPARAVWTGHGAFVDCAKLEGTASVSDCTVFDRGGRVVARGGFVEFNARGRTRGARPVQELRFQSRFHDGFSLVGGGELLPTGWLCKPESGGGGTMKLYGWGYAVDQVERYGRGEACPPAR